MKTTTMVALLALGTFTLTANAYPGAWETRTSATAKADLPNAVSATRTPLRAYVVDHYSDPPVSNLVLRLVSVYSDDPENKTFYEEVLSGEIKRQFDEMRAAGALEF